MKDRENTPQFCICFDADDTLWESETYFRAAEAAFARKLGGVLEADRLSAALLDTEKQNVGAYGFGVKSFLLSKIETALHHAPPDEFADIVTSILSQGRSLLAHPVEVFEGVRAGLEALPTNMRKMIITKGDLKDQWRKIEASGLAPLFDDIHVVIEKDTQTYAQICQTHGIDPLHMIMVGNSIKSDILPVLNLGGHAIYIPHALTWSFEHAELPKNHAKFQQCENFLHAILAIQTLIDAQYIPLK